MPLGSLTRGVGLTKTSKEVAAMFGWDVKALVV